MLAIQKYRHNYLQINKHIGKTKMRQNTLYYLYLVRFNESFININI